MPARSSRRSSKQDDEDATSGSRPRRSAASAKFFSYADDQKEATKEDSDAASEDNMEEEVSDDDDRASKRGRGRSKRANSSGSAGKGGRKSKSTPRPKRVSPREAASKPKRYTEDFVADGDEEMDSPAEEDAEDDDSASEMSGSEQPPVRGRSKKTATKKTTGSRATSESRRTSSRANKFKGSLGEPPGTSIKDLFLRAEAEAKASTKSQKSMSSNSSNKRQRGMFSSSEDTDESGNKKSRRQPARSSARSAGTTGKRSQLVAYNTKKKQTKSPARHHRKARLKVQVAEHGSSSEDDSLDGSHGDESSEGDDYEHDEQEPFKIQKILAARSEPRRVWKELCKNMNTSEIDYGSRWFQDRDSNNKEDGDDETYEERFLVKWNGFSYLHCSWETEKDLLECIDGAKTYLSTFFRKSINGVLFSPDERCDGDYFDPAYTQIERILYVNDQGATPEGGSEDVIKTTLENEDELTHADRGIILDKTHPDFSNGTGRQFMIKWMGMAYTECTYEFERDLLLHEIEYKEPLKDFLKRNTKPSHKALKQRLKTGDDELRQVYKIFGDKVKMSDSKREELATKYQKALEDVVYKNGGQLRDYQAEGVAWMTRNFVNKRGSILADEMGLGKTIQTATFINQLSTKLGQRGPFLIVAPLSTLAHWYREFTGWTELNTIVYHGSADDRRLIRELEMAYECDRPVGGSVGLKQFYLRKCGTKNQTRLTSPWMVEVVITTPEMLCADDFGELTVIPWDVVVVDEAHRLKNHNSKFGVNLRDPRFHFGHKLLLTGTPIQNDVKEFWTLLHVIEPDKFNDCDDFLRRYGDMKSKESVDELHDVIRDFILRRLKEDVEKSVPPKEETLIEVELTISQKQYYRALYEKNVKFLHKKKKKALDGPSLNNLAMQLRKCCNHLFLLNGVEADVREKEALEKKERGEEEKEDDDPIKRRKKMLSEEADFLAKQSGKLVLLDKLLPRLKENGHRVLLFSQFKIMLDVLEDYFHNREMKFERIDGSITGKKRQQAIDRFQAPSVESKEQPFIMLLSTRAGGVGINLTAADTCIIFDSDWNPQNDLQAQARCHRIGQTKSVKVYRLLTSKTYEMQMFHMSSLKMGLDQAVLQGFESGGSDTGMTKEEVERLLRHGAYDIFNEEKAGAAEAESNAFIEQDIDSILERRARTVVHDNTGSQSNAAGGTFSKARFTASTNNDNDKVAEEDVDVQDPDFWKKMVGEPIDEDLTSDLPAKRRKRNMTSYSEVEYDKRIRESMHPSDAEMDIDDDGDAGGVSSDDDSFAEGDEENQERSRWSGPGHKKGTGWRREHVEKLFNLIQRHGYGNIPWDAFCKQLGLSSDKYTNQEIIRMSWASLLVLLRETAEDDAQLAKKREERAAEKRKAAAAEAADEDGEKQHQLPNAATSEGGVLAAIEPPVSTTSYQHLVQKSFKKLWNTHVVWARFALNDAIIYAQNAAPRSKQVIDNKLSTLFASSTSQRPLKKGNNNGGVDDEKNAFESLFASFWPSLRNRGWKAEILDEGDSKGKTRYQYGTKQHLSPESVLQSAKIIHPELSKNIDQLLVVSESTRQESLKSEAHLRNQHLALNHKNITAESISEFLKKYAPLQLLYDRTRQRRVHLSKKILSHCSLLRIAHNLVLRAGGIERLATMLIVDKRMSLPHPLWSSKHDAILIQAIAKHGWIDHEDSCREIIDDSTIKWGFPFDSNENNASGGTTEGADGGASQRDELVKNLRDTAVRAAKFFNAEGKGLEEMKGFNSHLVISAYGLVREANDQNDEEASSMWSVDDASLMASTGLKTNNDTQEALEDVEFPTKRDLVKRAKVVLSRSAEAEASNSGAVPNASTSQTASQASSNFVPQNGDSSGQFCVIDQSERCNVFLAELLRAMLKLPYPKMSKEARLLCSLAYDEARKQYDSIVASSDQPNGGKKAEEMQKIMHQIGLVKRFLPSIRQAKNVIRVMLGQDPVPSRNAAEGLFPITSAAGLQAAAQRGPGGFNLMNNVRRDDVAAGDRAISRSMKRVFDANAGMPGTVSSSENKASELELTAIETLIVSVVCSQGFPVWEQNSDTLFFGYRENENGEKTVFSGDKSQLLWAGIGNVLEAAAKDWYATSKRKLLACKEDYTRFENGADLDAKLRARKNLDVAKAMEKVKRLSAAQAADYASDPQVLAKKTIMLLERIRLSMGPTGNSKNNKKHNNWLGSKIFQWFGNQLSKWALSLEIVDDVKKTLSYTAADFFHDLPPDQKKHLDVVSSFTKQDCKNVVSQISLLVRLRSFFLKYDENELWTKVDKAVRNSRNSGDVWDKQPAWWGIAEDPTQHYCIRHDMLMLNSLLKYGFGGMLEYGQGFGPKKTDEQHHSSLRELGLTKSSIQERANMIVRELDSHEGTEELIRLLGERKKQNAGDANNNAINVETDSNAQLNRSQKGLHSFFGKTGIAGKENVVVLLDDDNQVQSNPTCEEEKDVEVVMVKPPNSDPINEGSQGIEESPSKKIRIS